MRHNYVGSAFPEEVRVRVSGHANACTYMHVGIYIRGRTCVCVHERACYQLSNPHPNPNPHLALKFLNLFIFQFFLSARGIGLGSGLG